MCISIDALAVEPRPEMVLADLVKHTAMQIGHTIRSYSVYHYHQSNAVGRKVVAPSFQFRLDLICQFQFRLDLIWSGRLRGSRREPKGFSDKLIR